MKIAERNFGMWLIGRSIKVDQEAGQKGRVTRRKGSLEKQVTQAVLLGQTVLAAGYKMDHRMSPGEERMQWADGTRQQKSEDLQQRRTNGRPGQREDERSTRKDGRRKTHT